MSWRHKLADLLTGGASSDADKYRAMAWDFADKLNQSLKKGDELFSNLMSAEFQVDELKSTIKAQRAALDQISTELTGHIDAMRSGPPTAPALRAIRALTKGPHK